MKFTVDPAHCFTAAFTLLTVFILSVLGGMLSLLVPRLYESIGVTHAPPEAYLAHIQLTPIAFVFVLAVVVVGASFLTRSRNVSIATCISVLVFISIFLIAVILAYADPLVDYFRNGWVT